MIATQPTVEVVTAGTDWAAIIAAIVTGLAAILGIVGTAWQAGRARAAATADLRTSIDAAAVNQQANIEAAAGNLRARDDAEDKRALRSEKMRLYSDFQAAIDSALFVGGASDPREDIAAVYRSASVVILIATEEIGTLVRYLAEEVTKGREEVVSTGSVPDTIHSKREKLYGLMRIDLGTNQD
jgi:hypothetical protein